jgi:ABC-2 type transport system permease protein
MAATDTAPTSGPLVRQRALVRTYLRVGALHELQYRVNFWLQLLESVVALATAIAVIALVFANTTELAGWALDELLVVLGVHVALGGVIKAIVQPNMLKLVEDIRQGDVDFLLLTPADALLLASIRQVAFWKLVDVVVGVGVIAVAIARPGVALSWSGIGIGVLLLALGAVIVWCFWVILTVSAFWIVRAEHIVELFSGLYQAGRWPISIYPLALRAVFTVVVPLAFAVTVPAQAVTGRLSVGGFLGALVFTALLVGATRWAWSRGLQRYDGASA